MIVSLRSTTQMGQPRIFASMARDGLLPPLFAKVSIKTGTPIESTIICGIIAALFAAFFPIDFLANMSSVGTLLAFALVCVSLIVARFKFPDIERPFRLGGHGKFGDWFGIVFCVVGAILCLGLLIASSIGQWQILYRVAVWDGLGLVFYYTYGVYHSSMARHPEWQENPELNPDMKGFTDQKSDSASGIPVAVAEANKTIEEGVSDVSDVTATERVSAEEVVAEMVKEFGEPVDVYPVVGGHAKPGDENES